MNENPTFQGYVTKYALSCGIVEAELRPCRTDGLVCADKIGNGLYLQSEGREWHRTRESAVKRAEEMRVKKIASLKKQIAKLEKLKFDQPPA